MRRLLIGLITILLAASVAGCADTSYKGITNLPEINLSNVAITEVHKDGTSGKFALTAAPERVLLVFFGFTNCPDICPTTLADIRQARKLIGSKAERVEIAFVSVDRERDTPEVLTTYLDQYDFGTSVHALRPVDDNELATATKPVFASTEVKADDAGTPQVNHSSWVYIVDEEGRVVLEWSYPTSAKDMAHDLRLLLD